MLVPLQARLLVLLLMRWAHLLVGLLLLLLRRGLLLWLDGLLVRHWFRHGWLQVQPRTQAGLLRGLVRAAPWLPRLLLLKWSAEAMRRRLRLHRPTTCTIWMVM